MIHKLFNFKKRYNDLLRQIDAQKKQIDAQKKQIDSLYETQYINQSKCDRYRQQLERLNDTLYKSSGEIADLQIRNERLQEIYNDYVYSTDKNIMELKAKIYSLEKNNATNG